MNTLAIAKLSASRRRREGGAVMFIVAMTLAVLASVGIYALAAASNELRTSGNERQSTQSHYLSQYGVIAAAQELASTKAQFYLGLMLSQPDVNCVSLQGVPANASPISKACRRMGLQELASGSGWAANATVPYPFSTPYAGAPGSLGPTPLKPDFYIELTEPTTASSPARYALSLQFCFIQMVTTSVGITQPQYPSLGTTPSMFGGEGLEMQRARLVAGPIQCPR
ncbi:MAG TPA: hypothetical protein VEK07_15250 [Polyangiaceae bacterium]|nr:hypothetical protein [Polyangiaceae bacterium]